MTNNSNIGGRVFHLVRYFFIASLVSVIIAATVLGLLYRNIAEQNLIELGGNKNAALSKVFINTIWPYYSDFIPELEKLSSEQVREHPITYQLKRDIVRNTIGVDVVKVNIYTPKGYTIFSTTMRDIGEDDSDHPHFQTAVNGHVATEFKSRNAMPGLDGGIKDRNLIASYIPIINYDTNEVDGVFELYSDVTDLYSQISKTEYQIFAGVGLMFSLLFLVLMSIVKRADSIIKDHEARLLKSNEDAERQAMHDSLTGLPNRLMLQDRLDHAMRVASRSETLVAVLFLDLDRFKPINDSMGHSVGDSLLIQISKRLIAAVRDCDTVARVGGDEFVIVLESVLNVSQAEVVARRILESLSRPVVINGTSLYVTSSIGVTFYPFDDGEVKLDELIKNADTAMYEVKKSGRNTFQMFSHSMRYYTEETANIEQGLHPALENEEFVLYFQPIVDAQSGRVASLEGLLRWNSPMHGLVPPDKFIPALERSGLIIGVGNWVIEQACQAMNLLKQRGYRGIRIGVNISAKQLHENGFVAAVENIVKKYNVDPSNLDFEITESVLVDNTEHVIESMQRLWQMGITFSIDDFGVGYSSLNYLKRIPVKTIKIDRGFVSEMTTCADDAAILEAIVVLSKSLNLNTVAEGVETEEQRRFILRKQVNFVQGYLMCRPMPLSQLMEVFSATESGVWLIDQQNSSASN